MTNDPVRMNFSLTVSGEVKQFAKISPDFVRFAGYQNEKLVKTVRISPLPDNPFKILSITPSHKEFITCSLRSLATGNITEYEIIIENIYKKTGNYNDTIIVKTNSTVMPDMEIPVNAYILPPQPSGNK
jgi:hypothetical protein